MVPSKYLRNVTDDIYETLQTITRTYNASDAIFLVITVLLFSPEKPTKYLI